MTCCCLWCKDAILFAHSNKWVCVKSEQSPSDITKWKTAHCNALAPKWCPKHKEQTQLSFEQENFACRFAWKYLREFGPLSVDCRPEKDTIIQKILEQFRKGLSTKKVYDRLAIRPKTCHVMAAGHKVNIGRHLKMFNK